MAVHTKSNSTPPMRILRYNPERPVTDFDCGDEDLNDFIINEAHAYQKALLAVTYLVESTETGELLAYFSLANDRVSLSDFETKTEFNKFRSKRFRQQKRLKSYPAVKLCRLAVSTKARGMHLGTKLLDYINLFFTDNNKTGCRFVTVDAYRGALDFYFKNDFALLNPSEKDTDSNTCLLYFDLNEVLLD